MHAAAAAEVFQEQQFFVFMSNVRLGGFWVIDDRYCAARQTKKQLNFEVLVLDACKLKESSFPLLEITSKLFVEFHWNGNK